MHATLHTVLFLHLFIPWQTLWGTGGQTKEENVSRSNFPDLDIDFKYQYFFSNSMMSDSSTVGKPRLDIVKHSKMVNRVAQNNICGHKSYHQY